MIRAIDLQSVVNQSPNVEKVSHSQQQGNEQQNHKFSMQLEQERQAAQKRVADSDDSQSARKRDRKDGDDRDKQSDHNRKNDDTKSKREPIVENLLNIRILDITV
jgi:hypothetical protein